MKMIYLKPLTEVLASCYSESPLMANSFEDSDSERGIGGGVTNTGGGGVDLPTEAGETDGEVNPFINGQGGSVNPGNRAKSGMIWDEW
jgi:hypothetical protein